MSDSSDESDDCDDEEEDSGGDDAAHDGERRDDRYGLPVHRSPDQDKRNQLQKKQENFKFVFFSFLEDMSLFCEATDTPVLDFWWCLPEFQSQCGSLCMYASFPQIYPQCDTCWPLSVCMLKWLLIFLETNQIHRSVCIQGGGWEDPSPQ